MDFQTSDLIPAHIQPNQPEHFDMNLKTYEHAVNRIVPAMESGFTIQTTYGELVIEPGAFAEVVAHLLKIHVERELARAGAAKACVAKACV